MPSETDPPHPPGFLSRTHGWAKGLTFIPRVMRDSSAATLLMGPLGPSRIYLAKAKTQAALRPLSVSPWVPLPSCCTQTPGWGPCYPGLASLSPPPGCTLGRASPCPGPPAGCALGRASRCPGPPPGCVPGRASPCPGPPPGCASGRASHAVGTARWSLPSPLMGGNRSTRGAGTSWQTSPVSMCGHRVLGQERRPGASLWH